MINPMQPGQPDQTKMMVQANTTEFLHLLNPKNYRYLPVKYTHNIRFAGRVTAESEGIAGLIM